MAIDFPPSPTVNDIFTAEDRTWIYRGSGVWDSVQNPSNIGQTVTATTGTFNIDCQAATDFYLDFNDSYFTAPDYKTITVVNTSTADFGAATTGTLTLPASMQQGDLVIVAVGSDDDSASVISTASPSTGWTAAAQGSTNRLHKRSIFYKVMGPTPDTSINLQNFATATTAVAIALRNGSWQSISDSTNGANAGSGTPNAPSVTTTVPKSMVIAVGFLDDDSIATASITAPTGYSNLVSQEAVALTGFTTMLATKIVTAAGAEDPAAFTVTGGTDDNSAYSIIIAPDLEPQPTATINMTNIPTDVKEFTVFGYLPNIAHPYNSVNLTWDATDIVRIYSLPSSLPELNGFALKFFTYNSSVFAYNPSSKTQHVDYIKTTQTWVCPGDVTFVEVLLCGGGGGGDTSSGEGAGGGSVIQDVLSVTPGQTYTITIGAGGAAGSTASAGSTSSFGSLLSLAGGNAGGATGFAAGAGFGGFGGTGTISAFSLYNGTGISGYGDGGTGSTGLTAPANSGRGGSGGASGTNGGSGVCIIKYWSAY